MINDKTEETTMHDNVITAETQMQSWSKNAASQYNLKAGSNTIVIDLLNQSKSNKV